jgi:hypothetical protein
VIAHNEPMQSTAGIAAVRWLVPVAVVGLWLLFLTSRQVALFPPATAPAPELVPGPLVIGVLAAALGLRLLRPSIASHLVLVGLAVCAAALFAAQLGSPFANATGDYCGDLCRTAIMGRFATFFGWPIVVAGSLAALGRLGRGPLSEKVERVAWTRPWAVATLTLGLVASVVWWRIVLPNG